MDCLLSALLPVRHLFKKSLTDIGNQINYYRDTRIYCDYFFNFHVLAYSLCLVFLVFWSLCCVFTIAEVTGFIGFHFSEVRHY